MNSGKLIDMLGTSFYTGVPDSQLNALCDYLVSSFGISNKHIIAANEGNATALAAGYYLSTGEIPVVYMQNSGIGNIINPVASLLNDKVYAIPCIFIVGWRGEPGVKDEPQHIYQGEVTIKLFEDMDVKTFVISKTTTDEEIQEKIEEFKKDLSIGKSVAFIVRKGALTTDNKTEYSNDYALNREEVIKHIVDVTGEDPVISTTGKASRELFEIREANNQSHKYDFLTVGSMGHSSSIALGIALNKPNTKIWCVDGDGAVLMHMGSMAVLGSLSPKNLVHIILNNNAHETVGGMPTVSSNIDFTQIALGCGYKKAVTVSTFENLDEELMKAKNNNELTLIEVKCSIGSRGDLGRPTTTPEYNKKIFMDYLATLD